jgi:hypothetical protein
MLNQAIELKHGTLKARLLFCNRAYRDSRHELGNLFSVTDLEDAVRQVNFLISYLYHSYVSACKNEGKSVEINFIDFDEAITTAEVPETESNLKDIFDKAGETIKVYFTVELDNVKKKVEEFQKNNPNPTMMNSNNSSAENLDTVLTNSGTD